MAILSLAAGACAGDDPSAGPDPAPAPPAAGDATGTGAAGGAGNAGGDVFARIPDIVQQVEPWVVAITTSAGEGSGVIVGEDGTIVTNAHVVETADEVQVQFADGQRSVGRVLAREPRVDLALVDAARDGLTPARLAGDLPRTGELALAVGNPLGFENTVTAGIVSGLERSIPGGGPALVGLIQTDAPISPGNSGGALVNADAEVMGINVAYIPPQGGAVALGFAIPSVFVGQVIDELRTTGRITSPFLGVTPRTLTPQVAAAAGLDVDRGVVVLAVTAGGPADAAGIRRGDVLVRADDRDLGTVEDLLSLLRQREPGQSVRLELARPEGRREVTVELGTLPR